MIKKLLVVCHCLILLSPIFVLAEQSAIDLNSPVKIVTAFQKLESYELHCYSESSPDIDPIKTAKKFESYLTKDLNKLFIRAQCGEPAHPLLDFRLTAEISWDFRFGTARDGGNPSNIRARLGKSTAPDTAIVTVLFDVGSAKNLKNIKTTYTLIREDGKWKIDDIAPEGDESSDYGEQPYLKSSGSIKSDMKDNYNKALELYQKEQAAKGATPKP